MNAFVYYDFAPLNGGFPDGFSNTIAIGERYAYGCRERTAEWGESGFFETNLTTTRRYPNFYPGTPVVKWSRPPAFAVAAIDDFHPPAMLPGQAWPTPLPPVTFQVRPTLHECDPRMPQALHPSGLMAAMADGSVRTISPSVSREAFWGAVTPNGGEIPGDL